VGDPTGGEAALAALAPLAPAPPPPATMFVWGEGTACGARGGPGAQPGWVGLAWARLLASFSTVSAGVAAPATKPFASSKPRVRSASRSSAEAAGIRRKPHNPNTSRLVI